MRGVLFHSPNAGRLAKRGAVNLRAARPAPFLPLQAAACAAGFALLVAGCEKPKPPPPPPPVVQYLEVQPQNVPISQTWVTTLIGNITADVRAQVSGYLLSQNYPNGGAVKAGDVMFQIDPRPFQAALDQAKGTLAQAQAQNTANQLNAERSVDLYKKNVISREQYDDTTQAYEASKASVQAAQAAVEQAQLNLTFTKITAPVDGISSIATAQVGDLVGPSSGTLATVIQVDPIKVQFMVPEQDYVRFIKQFFNDPAASPVGREGRHVPLQLSLADGTPFNQTGKLTSVNNVVGITTGSLTLQGEFPNPGNLLRPGQFGLVTAVTHSDDGAMVVPQRAVINLQGMTMLAVIGEGNKVSIRQVKLGTTTGSDQIVTKGLSPGDKVVVEGVQKVKDGTVVNPQPYVETKQEIASDPEAAPAKPDLATKPDLTTKPAAPATPAAQPAPSAKP
jgi:membrane fusion protein (multidrug efflux system)